MDAGSNRSNSMKPPLLTRSAALRHTARESVDNAWVRDVVKVLPLDCKEITTNALLCMMGLRVNQKHSVRLRRAMVTLGWLPHTAKNGPASMIRGYRKPK